MEVYRKNRLPAEQAKFATLLKEKKSERMEETSVHPTDLLGPFGSGGGPVGNFNSPPPSYAANGTAWSRSPRRRGATPPEFGGSHNLFSSPQTD